MSAGSIAGAGSVDLEFKFEGRFPTLCPLTRSQPPLNLRQHDLQDLFLQKVFANLLQLGVRTQSFESRSMELDERVGTIGGSVGSTEGSDGGGRVVVFGVTPSPNV